MFGGPGWRQVPDGQWYLHLFDSTQPDLNWTNEEVRAEFDDIFRYWLDRGVDGFRIDVAHSLTKDQTFPDLVADDELLEISHIPTIRTGTATTCTRSFGAGDGSSMTAGAT